MKCEHKDGWILNEDVCINQENLEVEVICNTLGCYFKRKAIIDISEEES